MTLRVILVLANHQCFSIVSQNRPTRIIRYSNLTLCTCVVRNYALKHMNGVCYRSCKQGLSRSLCESSERRVKGKQSRNSDIGNYYIIKFYVSYNVYVYSKRRFCSFRSKKSNLNSCIFCYGTNSKSLGARVRNITNIN